MATILQKPSNPQEDKLARLAAVMQARKDRQLQREQLAEQAAIREEGARQFDVGENKKKADALFLYQNLGS